MSPKSVNRASSCLLVWILWAAPVRGVDLQQDTRAAFDHYVALTETRLIKQVSDPAVFLYINTLPNPERATAYDFIKRGGIYVGQLSTADDHGHSLVVPDGWVHHWVGAVYIPRASVADALKVMQDYDHAQDSYSNVVIKSHLLKHQGTHFQASMRLQQHHAITVTLDTIHDITYHKVDGKHWYSDSYSTSVRQVDNAGKPDEQVLPDGRGDGYLWRIDSFWQFAEQDGGVYVEIEAISLSRWFPAPVKLVIKPFVNKVEVDSLTDALASTRTAILKRHAAR